MKSDSILTIRFEASIFDNARIFCINSKEYGIAFQDDGCMMPFPSCELNKTAVMELISVLQKALQEGPIVGVDK